MSNSMPLDREASQGEPRSLILGAFSVVGRIAVKLGIDDMNTDLGEFGALLCTVGLSTDQDVEMGLERIFGHVERACTYPKHQGSKEYATLKGIVAVKASQAATSIQSTSIPAILEKNMKLSLKRYVSQSPEFKILVQLLREFSTKSEPDSTNHASQESAETKETIPGYPPHVNTLLYRALCPHLRSCSCPDESKPHQARLRLKAQENKEGDHFFRFEMLFSAPTTNCHQHSITEWLESKILVPRSDPSKKPKKVSFSGKSFVEPSSMRTPHETSKEISPGRFCKLLSLRETSMLCFTINFRTLKSFQGHEVPKTKVEPKDSLSLFNVLKTRSMSRRAKCILAYTLAKSVWQYYGCDWMNTPWTHHDIHLLEDQSSRPQNSVRITTLSCRPYLVPTFHEPHANLLQYYDVEGAMHMHPQVLALGILLIEIAKGHPLSPAEVDGQSIGYDCAGINRNFTLAWNSLEDLGEIDFETYQESVRRCFDLDLFAEAPFMSGPGQNLDDGLQVRRDILYRRIVSPLKKLLEGSGWLSDLDAIKQETVSQSTTRTAIPDLGTQRSLKRESYSTSLAEDSKAALGTVADEQRAQLLENCVESTEESKWLKQFDSVNERVKRLCTKSPQGKISPIKIAILDTGCNLNELQLIFNVSDQEMHIRKHWKDWAGTSPEPKDEHGHGTAITTVLLRIAQNAEIYVGRVSKDPESLHSSRENIADAIIHAAKVWGVDIVSLSFGFSAEIGCIKDAIRQAEIIKKDSIVFFAAAANEGANSKEMFPACLDSVISIRGTDVWGGFMSRLNPPPNRINPESCLFGTLGNEVPWDWPGKDSTKKMSGCSIAAPVAAGIAALILQHTASCPELNGEKQRLIKSRRGVVQVFKAVAEDQGNGRYYIAPWHFFTEKQEEWLSVLLYVARDFLPSL